MLAREYETNCTIFEVQRPMGNASGVRLGCGPGTQTSFGNIKLKLYVLELGMIRCVSMFFTDIFVLSPFVAQYIHVKQILRASRRCAEVLLPCAPGLATVVTLEAEPTLKDLQS